MQHEDQQHKIVSRDEWLEARKALLAKEKAMTRQRDELSAQRRAIALGEDREELCFRHPVRQTHASPTCSTAAAS